MKFFSFEKSIIKNCSSTSHLLIMAEGLNINKIMVQMLRFYNYPNTLCLVIAADEIEDELKEFCNMKNMSNNRRRESYSIGGVKICTAQTLITDILNNTFNVKTISAIFIPQAEKVKKDTLVAFIISIVKMTSKGTVIKAFSEDPIRIAERNFFLSELLCILRINNVLLYPRFHSTIDEELQNKSQLTEIKIKMPGWMEDTQLYLLDLIQGMKNEIEKFIQKRLDISNFYTSRIIEDKKEPQSKQYQKEDSLKENTLINLSTTLNKDLKNLQSCLDLLFSLDFNCFSLLYTDLYNTELEKKGKTWILNTGSHMIMEIIESRKDKEGLKEHIQSKTISSDESLEKGQEAGKSNDIDKKNTVEEKVKKKKDFYQTKYEVKGLSTNKKHEELKKILSSNQDERILILSKHSFHKEIIRNESYKKITFQSHNNFTDTKSKIIILLDFSLSTMRKIELLQKECLVYLLIYKNSHEEEIYLSRLRNEKEAFERFISEKASMGIQQYEHYLTGIDEDSDEYSSDKNDDFDSQEQSKRQRNTELNHSQDQNINLDITTENNTLKVIVDHRELRSSLPFFLHRSRNILSIACLEEGDYLFPNFIVERKSIYDLIQSFSSGRLLSQMTRIFTNHKNYYLLIEYDNKPNLFSYVSNSDTSKNNLISKFCLLAIKFPNLKFIHTNSDLVSVKCLRVLQRKQMSRERVNQIDINPNLLEILLSIPGINSFCVKIIQRNFLNLKDLIESDENRLTKSLGSDRGALVYRFFHTK